MTCDCSVSCLQCILRLQVQTSRWISTLSATCRISTASIRKYRKKLIQWKLRLKFCCSFSSRFCLFRCQWDTGCLVVRQCRHHILACIRWAVRHYHTHHIMDCRRRTSDHGAHGHRREACRRIGASATGRFRSNSNSC